MKSTNTLLSLLICIFISGNAFYTSKTFTRHVRTSLNTMVIQELIGTDAIEKLIEPEAVTIINSIRKKSLTLPQFISDEPVSSTFAYFPTIASSATKKITAGRSATVNLFSSFSFPPFSSSKKPPPVVLLHGFDSSCIEFRRLAPLLTIKRDVYVPDILGWGFIEQESVKTFTPEAKMEHLKAFIKQVVGGPVVVVGASLGGAIAISLAVESPELVDSVVLIDAQGFIDGEGPKDIPDILANFGVGVLKSWPLRMFANLIAYKDRSFATWDAMQCGRLHTLSPTWDSASVSFLRSGGFEPSTKVPLVKQKSLILWGRNDGILEPKTAFRFQDTLPNSELQWIENCGHVPHLEKRAETAAAILAFLGDTDADANV